MASKYGSGNSSSSKQEEEEGGESSSLVAVGAAAVGVAAVAWWGLSSLFGSSDEKMMKAPGKNYSIPRKDFEGDPAEWFRNNRSSSKQKQTEENYGVMSALKAVVVAGVALWGLSSLFGSSDEKMMKAPGKKYSIRRKDFETNPAEWFRNNRSSLQII